MGKVVYEDLLLDESLCFQILVALEVAPKQGDIYACQVERVSLPVPSTVACGHQKVLRRVTSSPVGTAGN